MGPGIFTVHHFETLGIFNNQRRCQEGDRERCEKIKNKIYNHHEIKKIILKTVIKIRVFEVNEMIPIK